MLVLSRKVGERIQIGKDIVITLLKAGPRTARIGIDAPKDLLIRRIDTVQREDENDTPSK